jgi:hypothetical protein
MYTMHPIAGSYDHHGGFYTICFLAAVVLAAFYIWNYYDSKKPEEEQEIDKKVKILVPAICLFSLMTTGWASYNTGDKPENKPVVAQLIKSEESLERTKLSKHRYGDIPKMFVIYKVPEGEVTFPRHSGVVYPDSVILYKN